ncbi:MAG: hypothetical protein SWY16_20620 [Cyanobacteriota bacterium]|nr:hypothetical protein [Cyanobacteriota bacterium]
MLEQDCDRINKKKLFIFSVVLVNIKSIRQLTRVILFIFTLGLSLSAIACSMPSSSETETTGNVFDRNSADPGTKILPDATPKSEDRSDRTSSDKPQKKTVGKTYKEPGGAFEIALPKGYESEETGSGIKFVSGDGGFKGIVDFAPSEGELNVDRLEGALRQYLEETLGQIEWQNSRLEPDGSVRVDWVGQSDRGEELDAVSYIEQRGNVIYTLSLYGVNKAFDDYREDVAIVLEGYKLKAEQPEDADEE